MPFFKVHTISKIEKEVIVEAENMNFAINKAFDAIRARSMTIPYTGLYFDEVHTQKLADTMTVEEVERLSTVGVFIIR